MPAVNQKTYLPEALSDVEISKRSVKKEKATAVLDANSSSTSIKHYSTPSCLANTLAGA